MPNTFNGTPYDCSEKTAIITGAAGLMGTQHAAAMLETGAKVIITDIDKIKLEDTKKFLLSFYKEANIYTEVLDVTSANNIDAINNKYCIDILINNAAVDPKVDENMDQLKSSSLENFSEKSLQIELDVGITGAFCVLKLLATPWH